MTIFGPFRIAAVALFAGAIASAQPGSAQTTAPAATCPLPNRTARILHLAAPDVPEMAEQQGITGIVQVVVSLDSASRVVAARVQTSPSVVLNNAALAAARASIFQTEIRDCIPRSADYLISIDFTRPPVQRGFTAPGEPTIAILAQGVASRPADVAFVPLQITVNDESATAAASRNAAIYDALRKRLRALGIDESMLRTTYAYQTYPTPPASSGSLPNPGNYGAFSSRQIVVTVYRIANVPAVVDAAAAAGVSAAGGVNYDVRDRERIYQEALAKAIAAARARAGIAASAGGQRLGPIQRIQNEPIPSNSAFEAMLPKVPQASGPLVEVRAAVTVTYVLLKP